MERNKLFDSKELNYFLNLLKTARSESSIESYIYIKNVLNTIEFPIPFIIYPKGSKFVRTRVHQKNEDFFCKVSDLSYRRDVQNITKFGRANEPGQSIFYCADDDSLSLTETSEVLRKQIDKPYEYLSTSLWISNSEIRLASLLTNEDIRGQHIEIDNISKDFEYIIEQQNDESSKVVNELIQFLSKEFSTLTKTDSNHYKITAAISNYIFDSVPQADGLAYPSTIFTTKGFNIALHPSVAENKLDFYVANRRKMQNMGNKNYVETELIESQINKDKSELIIWPNQ